MESKLVQISWKINLLLSARFRTLLVVLGASVCALGHAAVVCSVTPTAVAFGTYDDTIAAPTDSAGTVAVTCSLTKPDTVVVGFTLSMTQGSSGTYLNRTLVSGTSILNYNIYTDAARSTIWGDGSGASSGLSGSVGLGHGLGNNGTQTVNFPSYGRIPAGQQVLFGTYSDLLTVTVTW